MEERIDRAVELFKSGYNCSQSVVTAFADLYDLTEEPKTLLEVVHMTMPGVRCDGLGCPWQEQFREAFESQGYKLPPCVSCESMLCKECWNRLAEKI